MRQQHKQQVTAIRNDNGGANLHDAVLDEASRAVAADTNAPSLAAGAELERTLDRLEARMKALQFSLRTLRASPRFEL
jgi:hypothetical protein